MAITGLVTAYRASKIVVLANMTPADQLKVLDQGDYPACVIADSMDLWINIARDDLEALLKRLDIFIINDGEAKMFADTSNLITAGHRLRELGPKHVVIKKGEHGALLFDQNHEIFFAPALPLEEVFDPTGAGDTFAGGFMGYLAATDDISFDNMKRAIIFGSAMASFCVEKFGPERLIDLSDDDVAGRVAQFAKLVSFDHELVG